MFPIDARLAGRLRRISYLSLCLLIGFFLLSFFENIFPSLFFLFFLFFSFLTDGTSKRSDPRMAMLGHYIMGPGPDFPVLLVQTRAFLAACDVPVLHQALQRAFLREQQLKGSLLPCPFSCAFPPASLWLHCLEVGRLYYVVVSDNAQLNVRHHLERLQPFFAQLTGKGELLTAAILSKRYVEAYLGLEKALNGRDGLDVLSHKLADVAVYSRTQSRLSHSLTRNTSAKALRQSPSESFPRSSDSASHIYSLAFPPQSAAAVCSLPPPLPSTPSNPTVSSSSPSPSAEAQHQQQAEQQKEPTL